MNMHTAVATVDLQNAEIVPTNPRILAAAEVLGAEPGALVTSIHNQLMSPVCRGLYVGLDIGQAKLTPKQFREVMVAFLGREPLAQDISSVVDPNHRNVSTSGATRLLDGYLEDVLFVLRTGREQVPALDHLMTAWLVITFDGEEGALAKLEQWSREHGTGERLTRFLRNKMAKSAAFEELMD